MESEIKNKSQKFAQLLSESGISQEVKESIVDLLPELNQSHIASIYKTLQKESDQKKRLELEIDIEINKQNQKSE